MKYKNIESMLHNFGHSFCSLMNYVDDAYIIDLLPGLIKRTKDQTLEIRFPSGQITPEIELPVNIVKSVKFYSDRLPRHMQSHGVTAESLGVVSLKFQIADKKSKTAKFGFDCDVFCTDDRGRSHEVRVRQN